MNQQTFLRNIFNLSGIPIHVFTTDGQESESYERCRREDNPFEQELVQRALESLRKDNFAFFRYSESVPCGICGCKGRDLCYILGPFAYAPTNTVECQRFMRKNKIKEMPESHLEDVLSAAVFILNEYVSEEYSISVLTQMLDEDLYNSEVGSRLIGEELKQIDTFQKNHTYVEEEVLFGNIAEGNVEWLRKNYDHLIPAHPILLNDVRKSEEYIAVIVISLSARAAIKGGLTSRDAFLINDLYLQRLNECESVEGMIALSKNCFIYCAEQVRKKRSAANVNKHIEECKKDIIARRLQKIDLQQIADDVGISKSYMQKLFKHCEGISITEYIMNIKLEAACNMLKYSDKQINEISDYLCFGSVSYFSDLFKKKKGMSPTNFRLKNQQTNF